MDRSKIMKRAWELVKKAGNTLSEGLKRAWAEAKGLIKVKPQLIKKQKPMSFTEAVKRIKESFPSAYEVWLAHTTNTTNGGIR